jgi:TonB family protein
LDDSLLPPALQINPILAASAPRKRALTLGISAILSLGLFWGGLYLIELSQPELFRTLKGEPRTVSLLLQDEFQVGEPAGGGGGLGGARAEDKESPRQTSDAIPDAVSLRTEAPRELAHDIVPLETPKALLELQSGVQIPILAGGSVGSGIGNGSGSGFGNGMGRGSGRGRGGTWIHSASGEGIQISESLMDVKDYIPPKYPEPCRIAKIAGDVIIEVTIDEQGKPALWTVLDGHPSLAAACLEVLPRWKFVPVRHKGEKVRATFEIRIRFTLL